MYNYLSLFFHNRSSFKGFTMYSWYNWKTTCLCDQFFVPSPKLKSSQERDKISDVLTYRLFSPATLSLCFRFRLWGWGDDHIWQSILPPDPDMVYSSRSLLSLLLHMPFCAPGAFVAGHTWVFSSFFFGELWLCSKKLTTRGWKRSFRFLFLHSSCW